MNGFSWVRVDRATDRSAPVRLLARAMAKDELWALGCYVRLRLITAGRFPLGIIDMPAAHLELELDAPDGTVAALVSCGLLVRRADGYEVPGWQDDPAVREVLNKRMRAGGRQADGYLSQGVPQPVAGGTAATTQAVAGDGAATQQPVAGLSQGVPQPVAGGSATYMTDMTDTQDTHDTTPQPRASAQGEGDAPEVTARPARDALLPTAYTEAAGMVLAAWPAEKRCQPRGVIMAIRQDNAHPDAHTCRKVAEAARAWAAAYEAQGRTQYLPRLDTWISSGAWREAPPVEQEAPARRARTKAGDAAVTAAELGAIIGQAKAAGL